MERPQRDRQPPYVRANDGRRVLHVDKLEGNRGPVEGNPGPVGCREPVAVRTLVAAREGRLPLGEACGVISGASLARHDRRPEVFDLGSLRAQSPLPSIEGTEVASPPGSQGKPLFSTHECFLLSPGTA